MYSPCKITLTLHVGDSRDLLDKLAELAAAYPGCEIRHEPIGLRQRTIEDAMSVKGAIRKDGQPCDCDYCVPVKHAYSLQGVHHWDGYGWWFIGDFPAAAVNHG